MELKKATKEDFIFFFKIKSEPENMYWTGHVNKPNKENLRKWFYKELESNSRDILIAFEGNIAVGYSYINFIDENNGIETAVAVSNNFLGFGYGKCIVRQTLEFCAKHYSHKNIYAWILEKNLASIKIHEKAGYRNTGESKIQSGNKMYLYEFVK